MAELKSMKLPPRAESTMYPTMPAGEMEGPMGSGYGLKLEFKPPQVAALGLDTATPAVGSVVRVEALATVVEVCLEDGGKCVEMQITDAAVMPQPGAKAPDGVGDD